MNPDELERRTRPAGQLDPLTVTLAAHALQRAHYAARLGDLYNRAARLSVAGVTPNATMYAIERIERAMLYERETARELDADGWPRWRP